MSYFECPYCSCTVAYTEKTYSVQYPSFEFSSVSTLSNSDNKYRDSCISIIFHKCPICGHFSIRAKGLGSAVSDVDLPILPLSNAKQFPDYIPKNILNDYEEAYAILHLSPKASATLSRRCLQGMIHDFWDIHGNNLYQEISSLKDKIPGDLWRSIDALRQLGNIGTHMEQDTNLIVDIEPAEAESLLKLIEHLLQEWYINREERNKLYADIISANETKQIERKKSE